MKTISALLVLFVLFASTVTVSSQELKANVEKTTLKWTGKKIGGEHYGHIKLKKGMMTLDGNKITKGKFVIDMTTLTNDDLESDEYNAKLVGHLKSDDFFGVKTYPTAVLEITGASPFKENKATIKGNLTIKGKTHPIEFTAMKDGKTYSATLTIDRSKYDVKYGSKSFFDNLGDKVIYDDFTLEIMLVVE